MVLLFLFLANQVYSFENDPLCGTRVEGRRRLISNGQIAQPWDFPWQVGLQPKGYNETECGASIINSEWVLTAHHCIMRPAENVEIVMGLYDTDDDQSTAASADFIKIDVRSFHLHPDRDDSVAGYDIALVRLAEPIPAWTSGVRPICLPSMNDPIPFGDMLTISGWGIPDEDVDNTDQRMRFVSVDVYNPYQCFFSLMALETLHGRSICMKSYTNDPSLKVGYSAHGMCSGDSGGPDVMLHSDGKFYQHGINSYKYDCGNAIFPDVSERVSVHIDWIDSVIANPDATDPAITTTAEPGAIQVSIDLKIWVDATECSGPGTETTEHTVEATADTCYNDDGDWAKLTCGGNGVIVYANYEDSECTQQILSSVVNILWDQCFSDLDDEGRLNYFFGRWSTVGGPYCQPVLDVSYEQYALSDTSCSQLLGSGNFDDNPPPPLGYCEPNDDETEAATHPYSILDCASPGHVVNTYYSDSACTSPLSDYPVGALKEARHGECMEYASAFYGKMIWPEFCQPSGGSTTTTTASTTTIGGTEVAECQHANRHFVCSVLTYEFTDDTCALEYRGGSSSNIQCPDGWSACRVGTVAKTYFCESANADEVWYSCYDCPINAYGTKRPTETGCIWGKCVKPGPVWSTYGPYTTEYSGAASVEAQSLQNIACNQHNSCSTCLADSNECSWATGANWCYHESIVGQAAAPLTRVPGVEVITESAMCSDAGSQYLVSYVSETSCVDAGANFSNIIDFTYGICRSHGDGVSSFIVNCNYPNIQFARWDNTDCSGVPELFDFAQGMSGCQQMTGDSAYTFFQVDGCKSASDKTDLITASSSGTTTTAGSMGLIALLFLSWTL